MENRFKEKLTQTEDFVISVELVPTRGFIRKDFEELIAFTEAAVEYGKIDVLSLTDNPGGNPRLAPDMLGLDILKKGMSPLVHLSCKDHNRNGLESRAFQLNRMGVENVLALTGDYPVDGYQGVAKPSFDLDSVGMVRMLTEMNKGLKVPLPKPGKFQDLDATNFFIGACVSPFKRHRSELLGQYIKLEKKIENGAKFIITQLGYDMRKFDELLGYMKANNLDLPVLGNVYVLHCFVSRIMNQNGLPGCVVTDELLEFVKKHGKADDKGKAAFLEFAAKQVAVLRGLGFRGVHLGGFNLSFEDKRKIIDTSEQIAGDWRSFVKEIHYPQTGDCSLAELAFLCPEADCPKGMRNGPCGGSFDGICELQDRECLWMKVINRLDKDGELEKLKTSEPIYFDASLQDTSSWINFYLGRDHVKTGAEEKKEKKD